MTDLLQINGNGINQLGTTNETICPAAQLHTKRHATSANVDDDAQNQNHKRPPAQDIGTHKRMKSSTQTSARITQNNNKSSATSIVSEHNYIHSSQLQQRQQQQQQQSSHLLQQLMAPMPNGHKFVNAESIQQMADEQQQQQQWNRDKGYQLNANENGQRNGMNNQTSNSVLKNLLVSGCDISAGYICHVPKRTAKA